MRHFLTLAMVLMMGCMGPMGPMGEMGEPGPEDTQVLAYMADETPCDDRPGLRPVLSTHCSKVDGSLQVSHSAVDFIDGSTFVTCMVSDATDSLSSTTLYLAGYQGALDADCTVQLDIDDDPTEGKWLFTRSDTDYRADYHDPGSPLDGTTVAFGPDDCHSHVPDHGGL